MTAAAAITPIQFILLAVFGLACALSIAALKLRKLSPPTSIAAAAISAAACVAAVFPDLTTRLANLVGINRGTDLIVYATAAIVFIGFLHLYVRLRRVRSELTELARDIAIRDAKTLDDPPDNPNAPPGPPSDHPPNTR